MEIADVEGQVIFRNQGNNMNNSLRLAILATLIAIVITTTLDATGYGMWTALVLTPLIPLFARLGGLDRKDLGYVVGTVRHYLFATIVPLLLLLGLTALVLLLDVAAPTREEWGFVILVMTFNSVIGTLMVAITEEGFFRGVLWSLLEKSGQSNNRVLWITTISFVVWHLSAVLIDPDYSPPLLQVPIYLVNATLLGLIWGLMRQQTGSLWPPALYHSIWNALAYQLYGFGTDSGDLAAEPTWLFGPEIGLVGTLMSGSVVLFLLRRSNTARG